MTASSAVPPSFFCCKRRVAVGASRDECGRWWPACADTVRDCSPFARFAPLMPGGTIRPSAGNDRWPGKSQGRLSGGTGCPKLLRGSPKSRLPKKQAITDSRSRAQRSPCPCFAGAQQGQERGGACAIRPAGAGRHTARTYDTQKRKGADGKRDYWNPRSCYIVRYVLTAPGVLLRPPCPGIFPRLRSCCQSWAAPSMPMRHSMKKRVLVPFEIWFPHCEFFLPESPSPPTANTKHSATVSKALRGRRA